MSSILALGQRAQMILFPSLLWIYLSGALCLRFSCQLAQYYLLLSRRERFRDSDDLDVGGFYFFRCLISQRASRREDPFPSIELD
jgi:hypothetical protein